MKSEHRHDVTYTQLRMTESSFFHSVFLIEVIHVLADPGPDCVAGYRHRKSWVLTRDGGV